MIRHLKEWFSQLFRRKVYLDDIGDGKLVLWIESGKNAFYLPLSDKEIVSVAKRLNDTTSIGLSFALGVINGETVSFIIVPRWAFCEVRRLITQRALQILTERR